ncbi:MAG TPA: HPF/RaiA family ribosome-associated protein [Polyangia bacterium]|nr:HPF/RaiA family ribosome-associated protein [Polyangia bacterium]
MKVRIHDGGNPVDDRLRAHVERRLDYALSAFGDRVGAVVVRLSNEGVPRSPSPNRCDIDVTLRPRNLRVGDTGASAFIAVANASDRLARALGRALAREEAWAAGGQPARPKAKPRK